MLAELREDNKQLIAFMRETHDICDEGNDVASASLLENWIDEAEQRTWFLFEGEPHVRVRRRLTTNCADARVSSGLSRLALDEAASVRVDGRVRAGASERNDPDPGATRQDV